MPRAVFHLGSSRNVWLTGDRGGQPPSPRDFSLYVKSKQRYGGHHRQPAIPLAHERVTLRRMRAVVYFLELRDRYPRINLRRAEARVTKHRLDKTRVGVMVEHRRGQCVPK